VVVKPVLGSGSFEARVLPGPDHLADALMADVDERYEVETFVYGPMHIIYGLVLEGKVAFQVASSYVKDCLSFQQGDFLGTCLCRGTTRSTDG
jgi:hypothetical protein